MTDRPENEAPLREDDWLERALVGSARDHAAAYIDDDGFTSRVMHALPPAVAWPAWRKPALSMLWAAAGVGLALTAPGVVTDIAREALRLLAAKPISLYEIATVLAIAGTGMWTAAYLTWKA